MKCPNILLLHIKRFYFEEGRLYKDDCEVSYPEILKLEKKFMCEDSDEKNDVSYELIGLIVHRGKTMNKGHYIAYTL